MNNHIERRHTDTWEAAKRQLELQLPRETYITWLRGAVLLDGDEQYYVVGVHSLYALRWLDSRLKPVVERTLARITGHTVIVEFGLKPSPAMETGSR